MGALAVTPGIKVLAQPFPQTNSLADIEYVAAGIG